MLAFGCSEGAGTADEGGADDGSSDDDSSDDSADDGDDAAEDDSVEDDSAEDDSAEDDAAEDDTSGGDPGEETVLEWLDPTKAARAALGADPDPPQVRLDEEATFEVDESEGNPAPSLRIEAPFSDYDQFVEIEYRLPGEDFTGKTLELPVMVQGGGGDEDCPSGMQFYVKAGEGYVWAEAGWTNTPSPGIWTTMTLDLDAPQIDPNVDPSEYDPSDIRVVGMRFNTGDCGGAPDGKAKPLPATYFIDTIRLRGNDPYDKMDWVDPTDADRAALGDEPTPPQVRLNDDATFEVDDTAGNPPPSLRIDAPFSDYDQFVEIEYNLPGEDLTGKVLELPLLIEGGGGDPECPSGIQFYVKTGEAYVWAEAGWTNAPSSGIWTTMVLDLNDPEIDPNVDASEYDPSDVRVVGLRFNTGDCGGAPDGKEKPLPASYFIDTITARDGS
jgi:hypothetical protein